MRKIDCLCIHHSASASGSVEQFRREHMAKGWSDIAYHSVIGSGRGMPDGAVEQGRPDAVKGSAVWGRNTGLLHVCLVGDFTRTSPTAAQLRWLGEWLLHRAVRYDVTRVVGHKEAALPSHPTACPGALPLEQIRRWFTFELPFYRAKGAPTQSLAAFLEAP